MFLKKSKEGNSCCAVAHWVIVALLFAATLMAAFGVYKAHFLSSGATFGTTSGSLALLSFVVSLTLWSKKMCGCCSGSCSTK